MAFRIKKKENALSRFLNWAIRLFKKRPHFINLSGEELSGDKKAIYIGNHSGASGPMTYRAFVTPMPVMTWGAHPMCEGYRQRRRYLIDIFYGQKLGMGKTAAWWAGTSFAIVSGLIYGAAGIIPVYYDGRVKHTFEYSLDCLDQGVSVLIFPENSDKGYMQYMEEDFHPGYISLSRMHTRKTGEELPVQTLYYSKKKNVVVIGKPFYISELQKTMDKRAINEFFKSYMNELYTEYVVPYEKPSKNNK